MTKSPKTQPPKRSNQHVVNLLTKSQFEALIDGIEKGAFVIAIAAEDDVTAILSSAQQEVFRINLAIRTISRRRESVLERIYVCPEKKWFSANQEVRQWASLEKAIKEQYALGGEEALNTNLITRQEVVVLTEAIRAMAFRIDRLQNDPSVQVLYFDGREVFRIDCDTHTISLIGLSKNSELVYSFTDYPDTWFWSGTDPKLWKELSSAITFYRDTMHRVRMSDYRALFGNQIQKVIVELAKAMEEAEADVRLIERVDKTGSGYQLHPDVARLVQKDLDEGEQTAKDESDD